MLDRKFYDTLSRLRLGMAHKSSMNMSGNRKSTQKGLSAEFSDFREYIPGDDLRRMDWNVYARLDKLYIREYMEEKEAVVSVLIDTSASMDYGAASKAELARDLAAVAAYLEKRKISRKTAMDFGLGASPDSWDALLTAMGEKGYTKADLLAAGLAVSNQKGRIYDKFRNRLMFPVIDVKGDVVAFGGRVLDKSEPKYMNTTETIVYSKRRNLYGINLAKKTRRPNFILCEGNIDVITLHQAGFDNAVASMGTALTVEQTRLLSRYTKELVLCYDNDPAGKKSTDRVLGILKKFQEPSPTN